MKRNGSTSEITPAPPRLVVNGRAIHGWFSEAVRVVNLIEEEAGGILGGRLSTRKYRLKQWQFFLINAPECVFGLAVVDTGYVGNSFCWVFDKASNRLTEKNALYPLAKGVTVSGSSVRGVSHAKGKGVDVTITNRYEAGARVLEGRFPEGRGGPAIQFDLRVTDLPLEKQPMVVSWPLTEARSALAHKIGAMPVEGEILVGGKRYEVPAEHSMAAMDHTQGYFGTTTKWNWACFGGVSDWGTRIAVDVDAVRNGSDTNRNCFIWFDDELIRLSAVTFEYKQAAHDWRIRSADGRLDVAFHPFAVRRDQLKAGLIAYDFEQPIGTFTGTAVDDDDRVHTLEHFWGVSEVHTARW